MQFAALLAERDSRDLEPCTGGRTPVEAPDHAGRGVRPKQRGLKQGRHNASSPGDAPDEVSGEAPSRLDRVTPQAELPWSADR